MASPYKISNVEASPDYTTIGAFDGALGSLSDTEVVGELYEETYDELVYFSTNAHASTTDVILRPAAGEEGDGQPGGGGPLVRDNTGGTWGVISTASIGCNLLMEDFQVEAYAGGTYGVHVFGTGDAAETHIYRRLVLWSSLDNSGRAVKVNNASWADIKILNCTGIRFRIGITGADTSGTNCMTVSNFVCRQEQGSPFGQAGIINVHLVENSIALDFSGSGWEDIDGTNGYIGTMTTCGTEDSTGSSGLTGLVASDELTSITDGSEDYSLKAGATCIDAGTDLGTTDEVNVDITRLDRDLFSRTWSLGPYHYETEVVVSVKGSGGDYSTIAAFITDLDDATKFVAGSDVIAELYDETYAGDWTLDTGGTLGLNSILLTAEADEKHDGTAGTGPRITAGSDGPCTIVEDSGITEFQAVTWLAFDGEDGVGNSATEEMLIIDNSVTGSSAANRIFIANCLFYDHKPNNQEANAIRGNTDPFSVYNCFFWNITGSRSGGSVTRVIWGVGGTRSYRCYNNSIWGYHHTHASSSGACYGLGEPNATLQYLQNNIVGGGTHAGSGTLQNIKTLDGDPNVSYNATEDDSAEDPVGDGSDDGTNFVTSITSAVFVSVALGTEDLRLASGATSLHDAGNGSLSDTPPSYHDLGSRGGWNTDIDGATRDDTADADWSIGAHEYVDAGGASGTITEGVKAGDSVSAMLTGLATYGEGVDAGETFSATVIRQAVYSEGVEVGETFAAIISVAAAYAEGIDLGENFDVVKTTVVALSEGVKAGDLKSAAAVLVASIAEGVDAGDSQTAAAILTASVSEGVDAGDSQTAIGVIAASVTEGAKAGDTQTSSVAGALTAALTEGAKAGDAFAIAALLGAAISEGVDAGETWATQLLAQAALSDGVDAGDEFAATSGVAGAISEGIEAGETWAGTVTSAIQGAISEGTKAGEMFVTSLTALAALTEGVVTADILVAAVTLPVAINEGVVVGDAWTATVIRAASISEGAKMGETFGGVTDAEAVIAVIQDLSRMYGMNPIARFGGSMQ